MQPLACDVLALPRRRALRSVGRAGGPGCSHEGLEQQLVLVLRLHDRRLPVAGRHRCKGPPHAKGVESRGFFSEKAEVRRGVDTAERKPQLKKAGALLFFAEPNRAESELKPSR